MQTLYDFELKDITGEVLPLKRFEGRVVLIVNVASKCGLTPQYAQLEVVYQKFKDRGLVVLGLPCNQFAGQEPWPEDQIKRFCSTEYEITFPMSGKIEVNGDKRHPLYQWLSGDQARFPGEISWNFEKFLIDREGKAVQRFEPTLEPDARAVINAIEAVL